MNSDEDDTDTIVETNPITCRETSESKIDLKYQKKVTPKQRQKKSKKQKAAEQRRREKEMEAIADEIAEKVKSDEERVEKKKQAELEKLIRLEEEPAQQILEERKCYEKEPEEGLQEVAPEQELPVDQVKDTENQNKDQQKKDSAAKQKEQKTLLQPSPCPGTQLRATGAGQSNCKNFQPREVPPRFKQQKMQPGQTQAPKKDSSSPPSSDFGTWYNPGGEESRGTMNIGMANWGMPSNVGSAGGEIIVDSQDKEAWPSIGDRSSESASECGDIDSASVKSGSVISSSSNPGQGQGQGQGHSDTSQGQSQSAIQGQSSSSVWGSNAYGIGEEKMDSTSNWGSNTSSLGVSGGVWGSPSPNSMASQGNMQTSNPSVTASNSQATNQSLGWGMNNGQNSMNASSGAQNSSSGPAASRNSMAQSDGFSNNIGSAVWQGVRSGLPKSDSSAWNMPNSSSVMASSISQASPGNSLNSKPASGGITDQWGQPGGISSPPPSGWGDPDPKITESTGWGDPDPTPIANAGTEGWGAPETAKPPQAWGASDKMASGSGWNQPPANKQSSGWSQQPEKRWGECEPPKPPQPPGWNQNEPQRPGPSAWGAPGDDKPTTPSTHQWGAANPQQSQWAAGTQPNSAQGAWGLNSNQSRPIGSQPQPSQPQQPSTWAQAAGRGLPPKPTAVNPATPGARMSPQDDMIAQAVNSHDGWGKMPIRQDAAWDTAEPPPRPAAAPPKPVPSQDDPNHFHQPNNGTAIWEAAKESVPSANWHQPARNSGASGSSSEWISDNDSGTWNGPPGQENSNTWNGPPGHNNNTSRLGGGSSSSGSSASGYGSKSNTWGASSESQWENNKDNTWNNKESFSENKGNEDNVWDRDGTGVWGEPGKGGKMETGTWQHPPARRSSSSAGSWASDDEHHRWAESQQEPPRGVDDGTAYWGDPHSKAPKQWSSQGPPCVPHGQPITGQRPPDDKGPMGWGPPSQPSKPLGWGEPSPPAKSMEDGSAMWNQTGMPQQGKPGGWGDGGQWPGAKPKTPSSGGWNDDWNKQNMAKAPMGPGYGVVGKNQPPQMRSRLLQQLTDMGFKKEAAQNALISNNMNLDSAIADLVSGAGGCKPGEMNEPLGRQVRGIGNEDCGDPMDNPHFPASMSMPQNVPLSAQAHISNSQVIANLKHGVPVVGADGQDHGFPLNKGPSLGNPSSLSSMTNSSINPNVSLQQKLLQQQQFAKQQIAAAQGAPVRTVQSVQQQLIQQQIVQQLQMAVQAGLISPQLLNQQLTPTMLVMLQQLLQLQQVLQRLVTQQQVIQQNRSINNAQKAQQLEQIHITIQRIKQQIVQQQQQIAQAQAALAKQAPPTPGNQPTIDPTKELLKDLPSEMNKLHFNKEHAAPASSASTGQSRLQQWTKLPSPEKEQMGLIGESLNKAVGSKPNMSTSLPFSDSTWSSSLNTSSTSSWPSNTSTSSSTMSDKHPQAGDGIPTATTAAGSSASSTSSNSSNGSGAALDIEEFVPGKPWTGAATKSVEDDPFMTPGSARQGALTIKEDYVTSALRRMSSSPTCSNVETSQALTSSWNPLTKTSAASKQATWSSNTSLPSDSPASSLASELWGVPSVPKPNRPPPGLGNQKTSMYQPQQSSFNRSVSWAPDGTTMTPSPSWSSGNVSNWLSLKNLTPQIDGSTLKTLCMQHGPLQTFYLNLNYGQALVRYGTKEEALKAQKSLNHCLLNNTTILAEFVSDADLPQLMEQSQHGGSQGSLSSWSGGMQQQPPPQKQPPMRSVSSYPAMSGLAGKDQWNGSSHFSGSSSSGMWGSGGSLWAPTIDDHNPGLLPNDLLSNQ